MTMKDMRYEGSRARGMGVQGGEVMVVVGHLSLLSHFLFVPSRGDAESRSSGRSFGRSVGRSVSVALTRSGKAWQAQTSPNKKIKKNQLNSVTVTPSPSLSHPTQPAHNLSQELLNPFLSPLNRIKSSFPLQPSQRRLLLFRLFCRFRFK